MLLVLLLAGCASDMVKVAEPASVLIHWQRQDPVCGPADTACTIRAWVAHDFSACQITALETVDDAALGQEFRRCFGFVVSGRPSRAPSLATNDMVKVADPQRVVVSWTRETPTTATCRNERVTANVRGCAQVARDHSRCRVIAHEFIWDSVLGHELRHCFGWKHAADLKPPAR